MDHDIAIRLASTVVPSVSVEDTHKIVAEFLTQVAECSMCGGVGKFTAGHGFVYPAPAHLRSRTDSNGISIDQGSEWPCPRCGAFDRDERVGKDPRFIGWHCLVGFKEKDCRLAKDTPDHADCGYRIMLPLDLLKPAGEP